MLQDLLSDAQQASFLFCLQRHQVYDLLKVIVFFAFQNASIKIQTLILIRSVFRKIVSRSLLKILLEKVCRIQMFRSGLVFS